jgi:hypothetical protein
MLALPVTLTNGPSWVEIGLLITQVLTVVAAVGAYFAIKRQIDDSERQHREQMHASLRPLVVVESARIVTFNMHPYIEVKVVNAGSGPARDVEVTGWLGHFPIPQMPGWDARPFVDESRRAVNLDVPELRLRVGAMGAGSSRITNMAIEPRLEGTPAGADFLMYLVTFRDQFENEFPSKPRPEWLPGHTLIEV